MPPASLTSATASRRGLLEVAPERCLVTGEGQEHAHRDTPVASESSDPHADARNRAGDEPRCTRDPTQERQVSPRLLNRDCT